MSEPGSAHDQYFKLSFGQPEAAAELVRHYLPAEVVAQFDLTSLERLAGSFVDDELRGQQGDLLFQARLREGGEAQIYLLLEHKSYRDRMVAFQLLRYCVRIWERDRRERPRQELRPIVPLVVYNGSAGWQAHHFEDLFEGPEVLRRYWPRFDFELLDLPAKDAEEIVGEVKVRIALLALRAMLRPGSESELIEIATLIRRIDEQSTATGVLQALIHYTFRARESLTQEEIQRAAEAALPDLGGRTVATLAEKLHQEGRREGQQEGRQEGRQEGLLAGLRTSLALRFGAEGLALMPRIETIEDSDRLDQLLAWLPEVENLEAMRAELD